MYGKYVTLRNKGQKIEVWVWGTPSMSQDKWMRAAKKAIKMK